MTHLTSSQWLLLLPLKKIKGLILLPLKNIKGLILLPLKKINGQGRGLLTLSLDLNLPSASSKGNFLNLELLEIFL